MAASLVILALLSLVSMSVGEDRAHGLASVSPVAVSPEAYVFFNPNSLQQTTTKPCDSKHCSTLPVAATVHSHDSTNGTHRLRAGGIAGISLSFFFIVMGVYYVVTKRKANMHRAMPQEV